MFKKRTPVGPLVESFKQALTRRSQGMPKSARIDCGRLDAAMVLIGARSIENISSDHIARAITALEERGLKAPTLNSYREIIHRFLQYAIDEKGVSFKKTGRENPVSRIKRRKEAAPVITYLEVDEAEELLDLISPNRRLRAMVAILLFAGVRRSELLWLQPRDVDTARGLIHVRAKTVEAEFWQPKTAVNRSIPISTRLRNELALWPAPEGNPWRFPSPEGCRWDPDNFSRALRHAQKEATQRWGCLDARHTFATWLVRAGVSLFKVSKLLGNSVEICQRHYAHLVSAELRDEVELDAVAPEPAGIRSSVDEDGSAVTDNTPLPETDIEPAADPGNDDPTTVGVEPETPTADDPAAPATITAARSRKMITGLMNALAGYRPPGSRSDGVGAA